MKLDNICNFFLLISMLITTEMASAGNCISGLPADNNDLSCVSELDIATTGVILPVRLQPGNTVGLVSSAYRATDEKIENAKKQIEALGLKVKLGESIFKSAKKDFPETNAERDFAGTEEERAKDLNDMFKDPNVKAIFEVRGGYGSGGILELLDYELIKNNPKIIIGFSDITSLLLAIYSKTGLITFYGPMGGAYSPWPEFTTDNMKKVLFDAERVTFSNPSENRIRTINTGIASGRLIGGNFATLTAMIGSDYLPKWDGAILFLEDIEENCRRLDRMMLQLKRAGVLDKISGFIFGNCVDCCPKQEFDAVLDEYIKPLGIPAYSGATIGHMSEMFTLPVGAMVKIDADQGTITMVEDATIRS
jgi:muramoyltetrapeptide carboxypeptidase